MYNNIKVKNIDTNVEIEFNNIFLDDTIKLTTQKIAYLFQIEPYDIFFWYEYNGKKIPITKKINDYKEFNIKDTYNNIILTDNTKFLKKANITFLEYILNYINFIDKNQDRKCNMLVENIKIDKLYFMERKNHDILINLFPDIGSIEKLNIKDELKDSSILRYIYKNIITTDPEFILKKKNIIIKSTLTNSFDSYRYFQLNNTDEKRPFIMYKGIIDYENKILIKQYNNFKFTELYYALQNTLLKNELKDGLYLVYVDNNNLIIVKNRLDRSNVLYYEYFTLTTSIEIKNIYNKLHGVNCKIVNSINNTKYILNNLEKIDILHIEYDTITVMFTINKIINNIKTLKIYLLCYNNFLTERNLKNTPKNIINLLYKRFERNIEIKVNKNDMNIVIENINYNLVRYIQSFIEILINKYTDEYDSCDNIIKQTFDEDIQEKQDELNISDQTETVLEAEEEYVSSDDESVKDDIQGDQVNVNILDTEIDYPDTESDKSSILDSDKESESGSESDYESLVMGGGSNPYETLNYKKIDPLIFDPISLAYIKGKNKNREQYNKEFNVKTSEYSRRCQLDRQPAVIKNTEKNRNKLTEYMNNIDKDDTAKSYLEINNNLYFCPRFWCPSTGEPISLKDVKKDPHNQKKWVSDKCDGKLLDGHNMQATNIEKSSKSIGRYIGVLKQPHDFNKGKVVKCGNKYYATKEYALDDNVNCKDKSKIEETIEEICTPCCFNSQQLIKCNGRLYDNNLKLDKESNGNKTILDIKEIYNKNELTKIKDNETIIIFNDNLQQINSNIYTKQMLSDIDFSKFKIYNINNEYSKYYDSERATDNKDIYLLPKSLSLLINSYEYNNKLNEKNKKTIKKNNKEFYGYLPEDYNLIGIIMIALNIENKNVRYYTYDLLKKEILKNITKDTFKEYYNTNLQFIFNTFENFKIYLENKPNINKEYDDIIIEYLLNKKIVYYNNNSEKIEKNKLNILLLENNEIGKDIYMICPNYSSKYNPMIKTLVLIKKGDIYSILIKNGNTLHSHNDIIILIDKVKDCVIGKDNLKYKEYIKIKYDDLQKASNVITKPRILLEDIDNKNINKYIYDNLNKIVGVINKKDIIIPIQPSDNIININKDQLINIREIKRYYRSITDTYNSYNKITDLQVKPMSIIVIDNNIIGIRLENGYNIGISPKITIEEYKKLNIPLEVTNVKYYKESNMEKTDNRINKINKVEYETETYKRAEVEVANYLNNNTVEKNNLKDILEDERKNVKEKRQTVSNILKNIFVKFAYESENIDLSDYITTDIRESCINKEESECRNDKHCGVHNGKCKLNIVKNITNIYSKTLLVRIIGTLTDNLIKDKGKRSDILNNILNIFSGVLPYIVKEYETLIIVKNINEYLEDQQKIF
jgi:hypothetical protein